MREWQALQFITWSWKWLQGKNSQFPNTLLKNLDLDLKRGFAIFSIISITARHGLCLVLHWTVVSKLAHGQMWRCFLGIKADIFFLILDTPFNYLHHFWHSRPKGPPEESIQSLIFSSIQRPYTRNPDSLFIHYLLLWIVTFHFLRSRITEEHFPVRPIFC